jgi:rubrerythrin
VKASHGGGAITPDQKIVEADATSYCGPRTLANLEHAYESELCDSDVYMGYADQSEQEGYRSAAGLFRAVGSSELIHALHHRSVINACGVELPPHHTLTIVARSTKENLWVALMSEVQQQYERDPTLIQVARIEHSNAALRSFQLAQLTERTHLDLLGQLLVESPKTSTSQTYRVCTTSGYVSLQPEPANCIGGEYGTID